MYKLTGTSVMDQVNSGSTKAQAIFDEAVLYPNPYMVVTRKGYTKHYYAGTERLATVIGGGGLNELTQAIVPADDPHDDEIKKAFDKPYLNYDPFRHQGTVGSLVPTEDIKGKTSPELEYQCKPAELLMVEVLGDKDMLLAPIKEYGEVREEETKRYFYHGDHLGSANWITDVGGNPIQYIHYAPYGELIDNQQATQYDERYKFTGKERDWETGYDYYGARYLWSDAGIWTSVDPLAGDYPQITPYAYGLNNPLKYKDPNGKWVETAWDIANLAMDLTGLRTNVSGGNIKGALLDGAGLILDAAAVALPAVPGGAGTAIKAYRTADKFSDANKLGNRIRQALTRGIQSEKRVLQDMGLTKNTKKITSRTNAGETVNVIPDAIKDGVMYEVKDAKVVYNTKQIQGEYQAAKKAGYDFKIVTGEKTRVSTNIPSDVEIIRRSDLGPQ